MYTNFEYIVGRGDQMSRNVNTFFYFFPFKKSLHLEKKKKSKYLKSISFMLDNNSSSNDNMLP